MQDTSTDRDIGFESTRDNLEQKRKEAIAYIYTRLDEVVHRINRMQEGDITKGYLMKTYRLDAKTANDELDRLAIEYPDEWLLLEGVLVNGRKGRFLRHI